MRKRILKLMLFVEAVYLTVSKCKQNTHPQRLMQLIPLQGQLTNIR